MPNIIEATFGDFSTSPLDDYIAITPGAALLVDGPCRAIIVTVAGTVNLTTPAGIERNAVPCNVGVNPYAAGRIRAGGTATGIFAGY